MNLIEVQEKVKPILMKYQIKKAGIFGSVARGKNSKRSDVDILVEFDTKIGLIEFLSLKYELEELLKSKVDLVEYKAIKPRLRQEILSEEIRIYG
ncbi:nucleotidyltransferase family protein [Raineya sp.]|jgi:hypothetical protein